MMKNGHALARRSQSCNRDAQTGSGFALVATISILVLLTIIAVGMLTLSSLTLKTDSNQSAQNEAKANARMALMIAIGELQKEMGPDMRVSAEAAIFDTNPLTQTADGVRQPHWLSSYDSWGTWLNASYIHPETGETLGIRDTYTPKREKMFRRWLLSLPEGMATDANAPISTLGWDDNNSVILVGEGSLGDTANSNPEKVTRAYRVMVGRDENENDALDVPEITGSHAWWIGPENHKARIDLAKQSRVLENDEWETAQGNTAEVGAGALQGLGAIDSDSNLSAKLMTAKSLELAGVGTEIVGSYFFDLTALSRGVLASVRTGHLKKDLSLLFEMDKASLPDSYRLDDGDTREPSIRPMSPEIQNLAVLKERHFAPWTRMRHFYRMYRRDSDALAPDWGSRGTEGSPGLQWTGAKPWTDCNLALYFSPSEGKDTYTRFPIMTSLTYVLSLRAEPTGRPDWYNLRYVASPICVYWNPYNVELRVPNEKFAMRSYLAQVHTMDGQFYLGNNWNKEVALRFDDDYARMMSGTGGDIVFKPGEFRIFSPTVRSLQGKNIKLDMLPGFDPQAFGGLLDHLGQFTPAQNPKFQMRFSNRINRWKFNFRAGNTPASLVMTHYWSPIGTNSGGNYTIMPYNHHVDWFQTEQLYTSFSPPGNPDPFVYDGNLLPVAYFQLALKGIHDHDYPSINWEKDWRCRNWIQAPPFYHGKGLYISEDDIIAHTQRVDSPFELRFGPLLGAGKDVEDIIQHIGDSAMLGVSERVTAVPSLELPTAPISNLAGFAGMTIDPGWVSIYSLNDPDWKRGTAPAPNNDSSGNSLHRAESKAWAYQSGVTGPGIGNSFLHPMIPRTGVYQYLNNSISMDMKNVLEDLEHIPNAHTRYTAVDTKAYCDYWDHVFLLNDALWDDYFVSSLADQTRDGASNSNHLDENIKNLTEGFPLANSRYASHLNGRSADEVELDLKGAEGYLKAASYVMVDGMFNVNSTSVDAWQALFSGIRERKIVYRNKDGILNTVSVPSGKRIAISRFNTATTDQESIDPEFGISRDDGMQAWSGVRFLDDNQLRKLAEECVKQVKQRGPFLNFSEFVNRRLSDDDLGTMGALQSAIDYDDESPEIGSINYGFKSHSDFMLEGDDLGTHAFQTPEAAVGSRFAGIPGYVIQSDILKPIANTLSVRDDTFRIRAYGDSLDENGKVLARAWCEAIVQRLPEYADGSNEPAVPARTMSANGNFSKIDDGALTTTNRLFGRKFELVSFRWLNSTEI